jgi:hypothetical protein
VIFLGNSNFLETGVVFREFKNLERRKSWAEKKYLEGCQIFGAFFSGFSHPRSIKKLIFLNFCEKKTKKVEIKNLQGKNLDTAVRVEEDGGGRGVGRNSRLL